MISFIGLHILFPVQTHVTKGRHAKVPNAVRLARGDHVIIRRILLQHSPHGFHIFLGVAPVALGIQVTQVQFILQADLDAGHGEGNFPGHKRLPAPGRFVIEQNAAARMHVVGFAEVHRDPVRINLSASIGTAWIKRRLFRLRCFPHLAKHLTGRRLVITRLHASSPNRLQQPHRAHRGHVRGIIRNIKAHLHMALCSEIIHLIGL